MTQLLTAIGIGWGVSWLPYSADYSRFVRTGTSDRAVFWSTALGVYVPTVWLAALGAYLAGGGGGADPSSLVTSAFGVMAVPVLLLITFPATQGPIAQALNGTDFSWLSGSLVAGGLYWLLSMRTARSTAAAASRRQAPRTADELKRA